MLENREYKAERKTGNQEPEHKPNPVEMLRKLHMSGQSLDPETAETYLAEVYEDRKYWRGE